ncbi:DEAD/DEAH box helicase [bacterium]|nr:DEAD/DEAH box helicase [bacterium]
MASVNSLILVLEKHPFKGLKVSLQHNNRAISAFSADAPAYIRPMLRQSLLHKDVSEELSVYLDQYANTVDLVIKKNRMLMPCTWDETFKLERKWQLDITQTKMSWEFDVEKTSVFMLSGTYGVYLDQQKLFYLDHVKSAVVCPFLTLHSNIDKKAMSIFSKSSCDRDVMREHPLFFDAYPENMLLTLNGQPQAINKSDPKLHIQVLYSLENSWISFQAVYLQTKGTDINVSQSLLSLLNKKLEFISEYNIKTRQLLCKWLIRYKRTSNKKRVRLIQHLRKLMKEEDSIVLLNILDVFTYTSLWQLQVLDDTGCLVKIDAQQQLFLYLGLSVLFPKRLVEDHEGLQINIEKPVFHECYNEWKLVLDVSNVTHEFVDKHVEIHHSDISIDFEKSNNDTMLPEVKIGDVVYSEESLKDLSTNFWTTITENTISILDPKIVKKCEAILNVIQVQKKLIKKDSVLAHNKILHLLDWIQLRKAGVSLKLTSNQEKQMHSFLNFKQLGVVQCPISITVKPHGYQYEGLQWLVFLYKHKLGGILADDMGLGKTFQAILLLSYIKEKKNTLQKPHLIVVPPTLMVNWGYEFQRFCPQLKVLIYSGKERKLNTAVDVMITSYDLVRRDIDMLSSILFDVVIFDEAQLIKNNLAARNKAAHRLNRSFTLCLTGTPLENHVGEYLSLLNLVLPGFYNLTYTKTEQLMPEYINVIIRRSKPFVLRRLKEFVCEQLKPKTEETVYLTMSESQAKIYKTMLEVIKKQWKTYKHNKKDHHSILTAIMRLRQICISPYLVDEDYNEETPKFLWLRDKLCTLQEEGHSVLVFSQFIKSLDLLEKICEQGCLDYLRLDGKTSQLKRKKNISTFQESTRSKIFLISLKAGGLGLNLTKASYVFHVDPWWNPSVENQATDRVHRIGQTQAVFSYKLVMHDSIEQKIQKIKEKKGDLFNKVLDESNITNRKQVLSREDIEGLFI